jgi:hypothetical protein
VQKPVFLQPKSRLVFKSLVPGRPEFEPATVVIFGPDGNRAAQETAGFYVPQKGVTALSDEGLWRVAPLPQQRQGFPPFGGPDLR